MSNSTIFLLGGTGYLGSQFLVLLEEQFSSCSIYALVRSVTKERETWLHATHTNLTIIEGTLDAVRVIEEQAERADIVINFASCDHVPSSEGIAIQLLAFLTI